ncbi:unnamed protein product [Cuscuta campestris]|uniref:RING-type domain-containing protein n=1 Tax=Cuscuta campestris TaxID=132261 RepID=A0A484LGZ1_9ASTE|nr:unnamed protein product [Cuscuta campestris]
MSSSTGNLTMGKRIRKMRPLCCCVSPRFKPLFPHPIFSRYEEDTWTEVAKYLDGKSLIMLAATCKWFHHVIMVESVWKYACLRDLDVPDPGKVGCKWIQLYATAFGGSHSYMFRQKDKHIDWMRIGAFVFDSQAALLTENLIAPFRIPKEETTQEMVAQNGKCVASPIRSGIWLADLQLVHCPVCDLNTCDGTMQTLDARHIELFLSEGYQDGSWDYELLGTHELKKRAEGATAAIFDIKHLQDRTTQMVLDFKSWKGKENDWQPKSIVARHAVAINTNLQLNEGLQVKYHGMKAGSNGEIVAIRISQQLLYQEGGGVSIRFPFGLQNQDTFMSCAYDPLFTLRCSSNSSSSKVVLNLPCCGDFFVRGIDYLAQQITLYDPKNCLPKRFLNLDSLSSSPFAPLHYRNYTFLKCPKHASLKSAANFSSFSVIHCLSNSTVSVVATSSPNVTRALSENACETYAADVRVPVSDDWVSSSSSGGGGGGEFRLGWSSPDCRSCEAEGGVCAFAPYADYTIQSVGCNYYNSTLPPSPGSSARKKGTRIFLISVLCIIFPGAIFMACTGCFAYIRAHQHYRHLLRWSHTSGGGRTRAVQPNPVVGTTRTAPQTRRGEQNPEAGTTRTAPQTRRGEQNPVVGTTSTAPHARRGAWNPPARPQPALQSLSEQETVPPRRTNIDIRCYTIRVYREEDGGILPRPGQNTCAICQEDYQPEQGLGLMHGCQHSFHAHCLATWLQAKSTCPICRNSPFCPQDIVTLGTTDMAIQRSRDTGSSNWDFFWSPLRENTAMGFEGDGGQLPSANPYMSAL